MFKPITTLTVIFLLFSTITLAQTDSSSYDLGRVSVKKEFTQSITIKGSDLEHYQFSNLTEAINVWLYGTYSNPSSLLYVVDGNIIRDVNAYSIYDIDEITLVQNALAQVSGANADQQLVLIKLKTNRPGKQGIEVNGQSSFVDLQSPQNYSVATSKTSFYNQFYLAGFKNYDKVSVGISAEYQHDVYPGIFVTNLNNSYNYNLHFNSFTPSNFSKIKLNAFLKAKLGLNNILSFRVNYAPLTHQIAQDYTSFVEYTIYEQPNFYHYGYSNKLDEHVLNLNLSLLSKISSSISNSLSISFNRLNYSDNYSFITFDSLNYQPKVIQKSNSIGYTNNLLIKDNLSYRKNWQNLGMDATLNFTYRKVNDTSYQKSSLDYLPNTNNYTHQSYTDSSSYSFNQYFITPSISLFSKNKMSIQAGFVLMLNSDNDFNLTYGFERIFPFIATTFNADKLLNLSSNNLRITASFSRQSQLLADSYDNMYDLNGASGVSTTSVSQLASSNGFKNPIVGNSATPYATYNTFQTGFLLNLTKNLTLNYSFEYRYYKTLGELSVPNASDGTMLISFYYDDRIVTNRIALNYFMNFNGINWKGGINMAQSTLQILNAGNYSDSDFGNLTSGNRWSGGFTNRLSYQSYFAGMDILYQVGERPYTLYNQNTSNNSGFNPPILNNNSFSLQNLYLGEHLKISKLNYAEVYLSGRNILQSNKSSITDYRRFFGAGFKVAL